MGIFDKLFNKEEDYTGRIGGFPEFIIAQPPPPKEIKTISTMLNHVEELINKGEKELSKKYWALIADECNKYANVSDDFYTSNADEKIIIKIDESE